MGRFAETASAAATDRKCQFARVIDEHFDEDDLEAFANGLAGGMSQVDAYRRCRDAGIPIGRDSVGDHLTARCVCGDGAPFKGAWHG